MSYLGFAGPLKFGVDVSSATILFETWPMFMAAINFIFFSVRKRYHRNSGMWMAFTLGILGLGFVVVGQSGTVLDVSIYLEGTVAVGLVLALLGGILGGLFVACTLQIGHVLLEKSEYDEEHFFIVLGLAIVKLAAFVGITGWALLSGETISTNLALIAAIGGILSGLGGIGMRLAIANSSELSITVLFYFAPVFGLIWLGLPGYIDVARWDYLVIGSASIVAGNLICQFKADDRLAYKALVASLWGCGLVAYLWPDERFEHYYPAVLTTATMFVLLLSFRADRIARQISYEKDHFLELWEMFRGSSTNPTRRQAQRELRRIDASQSHAELRKAYQGLRRCLVSRATISKFRNVQEMYAKANQLVHSKQQGSNVGELISLSILGTVTVFGLLFFLPANKVPSAWGDLFAELASVMVASTVMFLFCNVLDLQRDRNTPTMEYSADTIEFGDIRNSTFEHLVAIVACFGIVGVYAWFLHGMYLGP